LLSWNFLHTALFTLAAFWVLLLDTPAAYCETAAPGSSSKFTVTSGQWDKSDPHHWRGVKWPVKHGAKPQFYKPVHPNNPKYPPPEGSPS
jgi:hypothetical protein